MKTKSIFKQSLPILCVEVILTSVSILIYLWIRSFFILLICIVFVIFIIATIYFFRNPERNIIKGEDLILSPADGKITDIKKSDSLPVSENRFQRLSIFLSLWNVHVNRIPVSGRVIYMEHREGSFLPAFLKKSGSKNQQTIIGIDGSIGIVYIKQIAGLFARRIVCDLNIGDYVEQGQLFGMIKFGSRIDLYLPGSVTLVVNIGDRVVAGESIIGRVYNG